MNPTRVVDEQTESWEQTYATVTHLTLLAHSILLPIVPALVMWLIKKDESSFVDDHGREAVNFQITLVLYALISFPLIWVCGIGAVLLVVAYVLGIVGMVLASLAAGRGEYYRYPMTLRFLG